MIRGIVLLVAFAVAPINAQDGKARAEFDRGCRHRFETLGVSCWIPKGLQRSEDPGRSWKFFYHADKPIALKMVLEIDEGTLDGRTMLLIRHEEGNKPIIYAALDYGDVLARIWVEVEDLKHEPYATAMIDWIADTLRGDGPAGLDPFLHPRRIDLGSGAPIGSGRGRRGLPTRKILAVCDRETAAVRTPRESPLIY